MEWSLIFVTLVVVLVFLLKNIIEKVTSFPYEQQPYLFSPSERSFFGVLNQAVNQDTIVLGKVRIADVIRPKKGLTRQAWSRAFYRISNKHFDYLLCDARDLTVKAVVELDDSSHSQKRRQDRDEFVEKACAAAGLTLHRFKVSSGYRVDDVHNILYPQPKIDPRTKRIEKVDERPVSISSQQNDVVTVEGQGNNATKEKVCPKCSSELVIRVGKQGKYKGEKFLACSAFPKCRFINKIEG